jgi:hypothetical protein
LKKLRSLVIEGNDGFSYPVNNKISERSVRNWCIFICRNAYGDNKQRGLLSIDFKNVLLEERISALNIWMKKEEKDIDRMRWELNCEQVCGRGQLIKLQSTFKRVFISFILPILI